MGRFDGFNEGVFVGLLEVGGYVSPYFVGLRVGWVVGILEGLNVVGEYVSP